jgi:hypothetical protein
VDSFFTMATVEVCKMLRKHLKNGILLLIVMQLFGCVQISNTYYVQGDSNRITATDSVNKSTKDLLDMAGSAYGDANMKGGSK